MQWLRATSAADVAERVKVMAISGNEVVVVAVDSEVTVEVATAPVADHTSSLNDVSPRIRSFLNFPSFKIIMLAPTWNPADLYVSRPPSLFTSVVDCISTAPRDIWSHSTTFLSAISPTFDSRVVSSHFSYAILVHAAPTGTHGTNRIGATFTSERHSSVGFENLSRNWQIGLKTATLTLQVTMQRGRTNGIAPPTPTIPC